MAKVKDNQVVCSACEELFVEGDDTVMTFRVDKVTINETILLPSITWGGVENYLSKVEFWHARCGARPVAVDDVKQAVVDLDSAKQIEVYRFMHDALGCRI